MKRQSWFLVPPAVVALAPSVLFGTEYLTAEQAQKELFPSAQHFEPRVIELTADQKKAIREQSGMVVRNAKPLVWNAVEGDKSIGTVWVDKVVGKHEYITYAVGLNADGGVKQVTILDYRETYGYQVREKAWLDQFQGKRKADALKLGQDIRNISGATLSSRNVTDGVRRIVATNDVLGR